MAKQCYKCGEVKEESHFSTRKGSKDGLRNDCKQCVSNRNKEYYSKNKDKILDQVHEYYEHNASTILNQKAMYYEKNKSSILEDRKKYYLENKAAVRNYQSKYALENRAYFSASNAKRKAQKLRATPAWADKEHIKSFYILCSLNREAGYDVHVDHIVPLQGKTVCGLHCEANLRLAYASDNLTKGNRYWPDMW